jgi:hypothetical protein
VTELLVGRVVDVRDHPGARAPSFLLRVDLGPRGAEDVQMEAGSYRRDDLLGRLIVVSLSEGAAIAVAARSHAQGPALLRPDVDVEPGTVVA